MNNSTIAGIVHAKDERDEKVVFSPDQQEDETITHSAMLMHKDYKIHFREPEHSGRQSKRQENIRNLNIHEHDELVHYLDMNQQSSAEVTRRHEKTS